MGVIQAYDPQKNFSESLIIFENYGDEYDSKLIQVFNFSELTAETALLQTKISRHQFVFALFNDKTMKVFQPVFHYGDVNVSLILIQEYDLT